MLIHNNLELLSALEIIATTAINKVSKDTTRLLRQRIMEDTYTYDYYPNKFYYNGKKLPTFQFLNAFKWSGTKPGSQMGQRTVENTLAYDWESLVFDPATFLHGSFKWGDMRRDLAILLNVSGVAEGGIGNKNRAPYWDNFLRELFSSDNWGLDASFKRALTI